MWWCHHRSWLDRDAQGRQIPAARHHRGWSCKTGRPCRGGSSNGSRAQAPSPSTSQQTLALLVAQGSSQVWLALVVAPVHFSDENVIVRTGAVCEGRS